MVGSETNVVVLYDAARCNLARDFDLERVFPYESINPDNWCGKQLPDGGPLCSRRKGHYGLHTAWGTQLWRVWGDMSEWEPSAEP